MDRDIEPKLWTVPNKDVKGIGINFQENRRYFLFCYVLPRTTVRLRHKIDLILSPAKKNFGKKVSINLNNEHFFVRAHIRVFPRAIAEKIALGGQMKMTQIIHLVFWSKMFQIFPKYSYRWYLVGRFWNTCSKCTYQLKHCHFFSFLLN